MFPSIVSCLVSFLAISAPGAGDDSVLTDYFLPPRGAAVVPDPTRTWRRRWLYSHGYAAVELNGAFVAVYFDDEHDPAKPFSYLEWHWRGFAISRWRGGSGWNSGWQYTSVTLPPWVVFVAHPFPIPWDEK
jgi:hypothetical protein